MPRLNISSSTLTSQNQGGGSSKAGSPSTIGLGRFSKNSIKKRASACKCSTKSSCTTIGTFIFINGTAIENHFRLSSGTIPPNYVLAVVYTLTENGITITTPIILPDSVTVGCTIIHNNIEYTILQIVNGWYILDKIFPLEGINTVVKCC
jgi:hypothetical protein